jgi:DNA-binding NtrC family response regulator
VRSHSIAAPELPRASSSSFTSEFSVRGDWSDVAQRIAAADCAVLLTGETGSGKGFVARWIHDHSRRSGKPFVPVNCGAIPEALIDSHLFGHARGAFSGADKDHPGLVRAAEGGTLLLDEIADLPLTAQARLLRLLEEREVQPVGYSQPVRVNVRIIAATSADLDQRVAAGQFRQDLLFRLDVVRLPLPPLRQRREEIGHLLAVFNGEFARLYHQPPLQFERDAMQAIEHHDWPGNVRELRTVAMQPSPARSAVLSAWMRITTFA